MARNDTYDFSGEVRRVTDNAVLIYDGLAEHWIPKSQIRECSEEIDDLEEGATIEVTISEWLAEQKGML